MENERFIYTRERKILRDHLYLRAARDSDEYSRGTDKNSYITSLDVKFGMQSMQKIVFLKYV